MLTKRENLLETIRGGKPDRFVNQFEFLELIYEVPSDAEPIMPGKESLTPWGVTYRWPEGQLGGFPVHDEEHIVLKDITEWEKYVKAPSVIFPEERWEPAIKHANSVDRKDKYVTVFVAPGLFEMTHHLMRMENALTSYYEEPEKMHDLIKYLTEWELEYARTLCDHLHPDAIFHHDDWGSAISTFISPDMFAEFFLDSAKQIYGYYKDHGVKLVIHHSDSYAATLVPYMIEMGIDIWQGTMSTNDIPDLIEKYGGQISFMGGIDSGVVDKEGWTPELIESVVRKECTECGTHYFIPNAIQGLPMSTFPGVYQCIDEKIDLMSVGPGMPPAGGPGMPPAGGPGMPPAGGLK